MSLSSCLNATFRDPLLTEVDVDVAKSNSSATNAYKYHSAYSAKANWAEWIGIKSIVSLAYQHTFPIASLQPLYQLTGLLGAPRHILIACANDKCLVEYIILQRRRISSLAPKVSITLVEALLLAVLRTRVLLSESILAADETSSIRLWAAPHGMAPRAHVKPSILKGRCWLNGKGKLERGSSSTASKKDQALGRMSTRKRSMRNPGKFSDAKFKNDEITE